jgi:superfamily II DNA or RNA helicase
MSPHRELRRWQTEALREWSALGFRGVASVVTGGGKTKFALACAKEVRSMHSGVKLVVVVPTLSLLDQWVVQISEEFRVPFETIGQFGGSKRPQLAEFNVMVINTARSILGELPTDDVFLVVDECHRVGSPENSRVLATNYFATLGLSATPEREHDDAFEEVVVPGLGPIIYRYDYASALADGVISEFDVINVRVDLLPGEQDQYEKFDKVVARLVARRVKGDDVEARLERALRDRAAVSTRAHARLPEAVRLVELHRRERAVVFHEQIDSANIICQTLRNRNHRVAAYHSGLGAAIRQDNLRMFRRGEVDVLVTCRAIDEGVDVPDASVAVIAASTASTRQRIQRMGRVLRPADGKSRATVYTVYATEVEQKRLEDPVLLGSAASVRWLRRGR